MAEKELELSLPILNPVHFLTEEWNNGIMEGEREDISQRNE